MILRKSKRLMTFIILLAFVVTVCVGVMPTSFAATTTPVNPNATAGCRQLLTYLNSLSGTKTLSGQFNYADSYNSLTYYTNSISTLSGKYAGLWGADWSFYDGNLSVDQIAQNVVDVAIQRAAAGEIVSLMWHMPNPQVSRATGGWYDVQTWIDDTTANKMITPGTTEYNQMISRIDAVVPYLQQLKAAGVTVLWRPYHEMNYGFFWWGGRDTFVKELWRIMYNRYTNVHGLNNLLWVWNVASRYDGSSESAFANYYPGSQYVDINSIDVYGGSSTDYTLDQYNELKAVDTNKVLALGECGMIPDPDYLLANGMEYTYFMIWGSWLDSNSSSAINTYFNHAKIITRDEINMDVTPTPTPTPSPGSWTTVDDRSSSVITSGTWQLDTWAPDYAGTEKYSKVANDYVQLTFTGTAVQYIGYKQNNLGKADIYIDNVKQTTLDLYSSSPAAAQTVLYEKTGLSNASHTIKVVVTGTKNAASSDYNVVLDAFKYR